MCVQVLRNNIKKLQRMFFTRTGKADRDLDNAPKIEIFQSFNHKYVCINCVKIEYLLKLTFLAMSEYVTYKLQTGIKNKKLYRVINRVDTMDNFSSLLTNYSSYYFHILKLWYLYINLNS